LFGITRHAYYKYYKRLQIEAYQSHIVLSLIEEIRKEQPRIGTRKLYGLLKAKFLEHKIKLGRDGLFKLLYENNMLIRRRKRLRSLTNSSHGFKKHPNLIKDLHIDMINMVWVSDITYIKTKTEQVYLFLITDAYSKKILGYAVSNNMRANNALKALNMALASQPLIKGLIHHSDRGSQYACDKYIALLKKNTVGISMTKGGSPQENAIAERVNGILKTEFLNYTKLYNLIEAKKKIKRIIDIYNTERPHLSCGMMTPDQAHSSKAVLKQLWKNYKKKKYSV
tara:strand:- start:43 stop:888 length:846 start_codon:yes stop_codon:yes gene_type:complete